MKKALLGLLLIISYIQCYSQGLEDIIIEKIPVTAAAREADPSLPANAVAYRVFVDMEPGYEMQAVFGDPTNELIIQTTTSFYNYADGVTAGRTLPNSLFSDAAARFDSYITVDGFTNSRVGILTTEDTDGTADGYTTGTSLGLLTIGADFETAFGTENYPGKFSTWDGVYNVNGGEIGTTANNRVLIGQFTTDGVLSFELNIQIRPVDVGAEVIYVARNRTGFRLLFPKLMYSSLAGADPTVSITSPANNSIIKANFSIDITADANDEDGNVTLVEFLVDGVKIGEDAFAPYEFSWLPASGDHELTARASDNSGNQTTSVVNVKATSTLPPVVNITAPVNGSSFTAGSEITISATATDEDGTIAKVEFFRNGVKLVEDATSPYSYNWTSVAGPCELLAVATDNENNVTSSPLIAITITSDNVPPLVSITDPVNNASVTAGTVLNINASASDADGTVSKVEFLINGNKIGEDNTAPYSYTWTSIAGAAAITVAATDNDGGKAVSAVVNITVTSTSTGPPVVSVTNPVTGAQIITGTSINIEAIASDPGGSVMLVEFLVNGSVVGQDDSEPYQFTWFAQAGIINIAARATDNDANKTISTLVGIMVNNSFGPKISITNPADGSTHSAGSVITIKAQASDADGTVSKVEFYANDVKIGEDLQSPFEHSWTAEAGEIEFTAAATDNQNKKSTSDPVFITVNQTGGTPSADTLVFDFSQAIITNNHYQLPVYLISANQVTSFSFSTVLDTAHVQFDEVMSNTTHITPTGNFDPAQQKLTVNASSQQTMEPGVKLVSVSFTLLTGSIASGDITGFMAYINGEACEFKVIVSDIQPAPPTVSLTTPAAGSVFASGTTIPIVATASDSDGTVSSVEFFINGAPAGVDATSPYQVSWTGIAGTATITARATDNQGNQATSQAITITVNDPGNKAPQVNITAPEDNAELMPYSMVEISAGATDEDGTISSVSFFINDSLILKDMTPPYKAAWVTIEGTHVIKSSAKDNKGALSAFDSVTIHVYAQPSAAITSPTEGAEFNGGQSVLFAANVQDGDNNITLVEFFVNNMLAGQDGTSPYEISWTSIPGMKEIQAIVTDAKGAKSTSSIIHFNVNALPVIELISPAEGTTVLAGETVRIEADAGDPDGSIANVEFFIDGNLAGKDSIAPYTFDWVSTDGHISITARATDNKQASVVSQPLNILAIVPYETGSSAVPCSQDLICMPVRALYPVSNVYGFDMVMQYDNTGFTPTGKITIADDLINPAYADYGVNVKSDKGQVIISVFLKPTAPEGSWFMGTGEIICVEFTRKSGFQINDTAIFSVPELTESYISGVERKTVLPGRYWTTVDNNFYGTLKYWDDDSPIAYDIQQPSKYLETRIYGTNPDSCTALNGTTVFPDETGKFAFDVRQARSLSIERDIASSTEVQSVVNGQDAILALKTLLSYEDFIPEPYQVIAMDVNMDGVISSGDISQINQRSVKMISEFKQAWNYNAKGEKIVDQPSKDWVFSDKLLLQEEPSFKISADFPESDGAGYSRERVPEIDACHSISVLDQEGCMNITHADFIGVMLGDVNGSYTAINADGKLKSTSLAKAAIVFDLAKTQKTGDVISFPVYYTADYSVTSLDFALKFNTEKMAYDTVDGEPAYMQKLPNYDNEDSTLRYLSYSLSNYQANTNLLYVRLKLIEENIDITDFNVTLALLNGYSVPATLTDLSIITGIDDRIKPGDVQIYPNPARDNLYIKAPFDGTLDLIDLNGRVVISETGLKADHENVIQVGHLKYGVYIIRIMSGDQAIYRKVTINR